MLSGFKNWTNLLPNIRQTLLRFPLPCISVVLASLTALLLVHDVEFAEDNFVEKCLATLAYCTVALTSVKLLGESSDWSNEKHLLCAGAVVGLVICFVWSIIGEANATTHTFFALAIALSLMFVAYIKRLSDSSSVWYFNYQTGIAVFFGGFAALVLGAGLSLILVSIGYLFEIDIPKEAYGDVWVLSWGLLFPVYVLANISREFDFEDESCDFPKGIGFIVNYLLAPIMLAYMAILYAYFLKIILQWELPRGNLGWMITSFGTVGIVTRLLAYPIRNSGTRLLMLFDRYYFQALIVPILLLAVAIGVRIRQYGVTEERYAVVLMGVWFSSIVALSLVKKERFHIKYVPIILALLAILASIGPWGAVGVSIYSQTGRFESLLNQHHLLVDGQAVKSNIEIPFAERKELSSIADYLSKTNHRLARIKPWFESLLAQSERAEFSTKPRDRGKELLSLLGVGYVNRWQQAPDDSRFNYSSNFNLGKAMADVSGFDFVGRASFHSYSRKTADNTFHIDSGDRLETITANEIEGVFSVSTGSGDSLEFDLAGLIKDLRKRKIVEKSHTNLDRLTLTQTSAKESFSARLILEYIQGKIADNDEVNINQMSFVLMLKFMY